MSAFRDRLACDAINVFLNLDYFGEVHRFDDSDEPIVCMIDEDTRTDLPGGGDLGLTARTCTLYAWERDLPRKQEGQSLVIDGRIYNILEWRTDEGMHSVTLLSPTNYY